jgi:2,5-diketo-D-gluconate reductase B
MTQINDIPVLGLGTYGRTGDEGLKAILNAIEIGYRHLDTAQSYGTEVTVGRAVKESGLPRAELFVTTKVADTQLDNAAFMPSVEQSLKTLELDYVDLLLIHWPSKDDAVPFADYMTSLAEAKQKGFAKRIGVSNYPIADLARTDALIGAGQLATNQIEIHPYLQSPKIRDYATHSGLQLTAYMPLAKGRVSDDAVLNEISARHNVTPSAIALAFLMSEGHIVIPSSANPGRLRDNYASLEVRLTPQDVTAIRALDRGDRMINPVKSPGWDD